MIDPAIGDQNGRSRHSEEGEARDRECRCCECAAQRAYDHLVRAFSLYGHTEGRLEVQRAMDALVELEVSRR